MVGLAAEAIIPGAPLNASYNDFVMTFISLKMGCIHYCLKWPEVAPELNRCVPRVSVARLRAGWGWQSWGRCPRVEQRGSSPSPVSSSQLASTLCTTPWQICTELSSEFLKKSRSNICNKVLLFSNSSNNNNNNIIVSHQRNYHQH